MKKVYLLCSLGLCLSAQIKAQAPFNTIDSIDINKIHAVALVHGDMWWDPVSELAKCSLNSTSFNINFASALWMSGYDAGNNLHIAAQTYRQNGNDYWPGPLDASGELTYTTAHDWAKIWKVNRTDVQYFQSLTTHTTSNTPSAILTWPAKGNTNAQGNGDAALTVTGDMAPFADLNGNGIYEPLLGEYPDFHGDQVLWWVFSDNGPAHSETHGTPLGVEVHAMAYAYNRGTLIDNVIYYDYTIVNKSINNYHNFRFALWDDVNIDYYLNNMIGFDSTWRMGICYSGGNNDGGGGGHPVSPYISKPPLSGVTMIVLPGDSPGNNVPVGSFDYINKDLSIVGNPVVDTEYNNYMRAKLRNGQHFKNDFTGRGISTNGYSSGANCNYVYPGDPGDTTLWSECNCNNFPNDRRSVLASNDFILNAGSSEHMVMALVSTDSFGGCPNTNFIGIKIVADTAWNIYHHPLLPLTYTGVGSTVLASAVNFYPNPANNTLYIESTQPSADEAIVAVYNTIGQLVNPPISKTGKKLALDISHLPPGLYNVLYHNGNLMATARFIKE